MNRQKSFIHTADADAQGTLYLVGTPIGNLEDMTMRAIRILREVELVAAEDTRQTRKLFAHFDIHTRLVSYHEHNKLDSGPELIKLLQEGQSIALVSDAGMPAISDPGADLVKEAVERHIAVVPVPGANAALSALIISGLSTEQFMFAGFPPRDRNTRNSWLEELRGVKATLIMYESPHRIKKTCQAMLNSLGNRQIAIVRELTKRHEEVLRGTLLESMEWFEANDPLGEYCLVIEGASEEEAKELLQAAQWWKDMDIKSHVNYYEKMMSRKEAIKQTALDRGVPKRDVYNEVIRS